MVLVYLNERRVQEVK